MEAAIRWSPHSKEDQQRFLIVDVDGNRLRLCQISSIDENKITFEQIAQREKLPNFTAFDWSKTTESLVAIGSTSGEAALVRIDANEESPSLGLLRSFPMKHQRKCNSITFSIDNLLATGLDRVRNDFCMNIYNVEQGNFGATQEPLRQLCSSEAITSLKFFTGQPNELLAAVGRSCIRVYDVRDSTVVGGGQLSTKCVHNLAIDPLDENYFVSTGQSGNPSLTLWDKRFLTRSTSSSTSPANDTQPGAVLEFKPAVDNSTSGSAIWSVRFSGIIRGRFGVLSNKGEVKVYDTSQYQMEHDRPHPGQNSQNQADETSKWSSRHYVKRSHNIQYPYFHEKYGQEENERVIAFDFMTIGGLRGGQAALALHPDRGVDIIRVPATPPLVNITALNELAIFADQPFSIKPKKEEARPGSSDPNLVIANILYQGNLPRRRCEAGYLFNAQKNKVIVADDPSLVELWDLIQRLQDLAKEDGMVSRTLDLSYLGVFSIWNNTPGPNVNRIIDDENNQESFENAVAQIADAKDYPTFSGVETAYPAHRQLCLSMCRWTFAKDSLAGRCEELIALGPQNHYKAIVLAVFHGHKDVALNLFRSLVQRKQMQDIGIGAVIACESVSAEQRDMCKWMAEESTDPYLQALLSYFVEGNWTAVIETSNLPLPDRVAVACKYLSDEALTAFLSVATTQAIQEGNVAGIVLTGLAEQAIDLFQAYIARTDDLQTAVIASAFTNPKYVTNMRWEFWKENYFDQMQRWQAFMHRTRFTVQHNRMAVTRDGRRLIQSPPGQATLRCKHCQASLARRDEDGRPAAGEKAFTTPAANAGTICPECGRHMPRCGICMHWLGTPDPAAMPSQASAPSTKEKGGVPEGRKEDPMKNFVAFCMSCSHGFHAHHAKEWFKRHSMCPVPDCACLCGSRF